VKERVFFSEEKKQKTFNSCACSTIRDLAGQVPYRPTVPEAKVFWFFSSEKNILNEVLIATPPPN
jgi:hypothetical protein